MLIDLHCHTKKIKTGDAATRNVTKEIFKEKISNANVKIVAITNHNHFDYEQYNILKDCVKEYCSVWPGIELDIEGKPDKQGQTKRGHLIVIANPKNAEFFNNQVDELIGNSNPDEFIIDVRTVFEKLNMCDAIYIPHFHKEPKLSEKDIQELDDLLDDKSRLFKETSDYRSLGVFSNFDYSVIIGSDVQNWENYEDSKFADIRLPIQTFEQFCLLAQKDKQIINTLLNQKNKSEIKVSPYKKVFFKIPIYEDVNVIFGQKGTGKSEILLSLKRFYEDTGTQYKIYVGSEKDDDFNKLLKVDNIKHDPEKLGINDMKKQFLDIYEWQDKNPTSMMKYVNWWKTKDNNHNKSRMKITECVQLEDELKDKELDEDYNYLREFLASPFKDIHFSKYLSDEEIEMLEKLLNSLIKEIDSSNYKNWEKEHAIELTNWSIEKIKNIADKCSDTVSKPGSTGFYEFAMNRFALLELIKQVKEALETKEYVECSLLGNLEEKGDVLIQTKYRMLCKDSKTAEFNMGINKLKECKNLLNDIYESITLESIGELISNYREYYDGGIESICEFIGISKETVLSTNMPYKPSNGERGILLMQNMLDSSSDVYLLDEPELGMGNSYITASILPRIKDLAKQHKVVIIVTHNANLAVATLPYVSILRTHENGEYRTYVGNAFYDELKNIEDEEDIKNWTIESMHTLEGGKAAFYGRKDIYESGRNIN